MPNRRPRSVAEEIGQKVPFRSAGQEAMVALLRTADVIRWSLGQEMASEDLTLQQYNVLRILRGAGRGGLPTLEVGARMVERHPGVTRLVDRLVAKGLVERERGATDRRVVVCTITEDGRATLARLDGIVDGADRTVLEALGPDRVSELIAALDLLRSAFREDDDGGS